MKLKKHLKNRKTTLNNSYTIMLPKRPHGDLARASSARDRD